MFVTYTGQNEILVTTLREEIAFLGEWFGANTGRDTADYHREEHYSHGVLIQCGMRAKK